MPISMVMMGLPSARLCYCPRGVRDIGEASGSRPLETMRQHTSEGDVRADGKPVIDTIQPRDRAVELRGDQLSASIGRVGRPSQAGSFATLFPLSQRAAHSVILSVSLDSPP